MTLSVSVLIPAHNEEEYINQCIASILKTGWPREHLQILVMDNRSSDATGERARAAGAEVLSVSTGRIGAVRNAGLASAHGEFVAYVDADCEVPQSWLRTAIDLLQSNAKIGAVGGPCLAPTKGTWVQRSLAPTRAARGAAEPATAIATSSFIARTSMLRDAGGFNEGLISGEDDDMSNRIRHRGFQLISATDCHIVHHGYPRTWWDVLKKEIWHGRHHIEVRTRFDLTLILTFAFVVSTIALPLTLAACFLAPGRTSFYALCLGVALHFAPPFLFACKRIRQSPRDWPLAASIVAVGYAYFAGHSLGVLANLRERLTSRLHGSATSARTN